MTTPTLTTQQLAAMPRVNLLPREVHERRKARRIQMLLGGAVAGSVVLTGALYVMAHQGAASAQSDLSNEQARTTSLNSQIAQYQGDTQLRAQRDAAQTMLTQAMSPEIQWSHYLNDLTLRIPDNVWITHFTADEKLQDAAAGAPTTSTSVLPDPGVGALTVDGVAFSHDDVAAWLVSLGKEKGYVNAYFSKSDEAYIGPRKVVNFSSDWQLDNSALSGRYNRPAGS